MSWTFQLQKINQSFERIATWYYDFMHRTEECFRSLYERVSALEQQAWRGPSDEQVERVLRKIIAERFADAGHLTDTQLPHHPNLPAAAKEHDAFFENVRSLGMVRPISIDPATLVVEPESVPSRAYAETFQMLEAQLSVYPRVALDEPVEEPLHLKSGGSFYEQPQKERV